VNTLSFETTNWKAAATKLQAEADRIKAEWPANQTGSAEWFSVNDAITVARGLDYISRAAALNLI
jgi:hypothetical protein